MYAPRFSITNSLLKTIGSVEAAKDVIEYANIPESFERQFQNEAVIKTIYYGTHIEGNDLTMAQTKQLLEGATSVAQNRDVQEVINYRRLLNFIDEIAIGGGAYHVDSLRDFHTALVNNIVSPDKAGFFRATQVVIREEETGSVIFTPPAAFQIPTLLEEFFSWLNSEPAKEIHPVIRSAIVHYVLSAIYPFVEGNGIIARAFSSLILLKEDYGVKHMAALEEQFDTDLDAYYDAFFQVDNQNPDISERDLTPWIEYYCSATALQFTSVKEKVRALGASAPAKVKVGEQVALSARQVKLIDYLSEHGRAGMKDLKLVLPMVSDDTILRDLTALTKKGIIEKEGTTKASSYILKS